MSKTFPKCRELPPSTRLEPVVALADAMAVMAVVAIVDVASVVYLDVVATVVSVLAVVSGSCRLTGFDSRRRCFLFLCTAFFFSVWSLFLNTILPFGLFFFILTADPADHALGSIYILSFSPEFYFGKK